MKYKGYYKRLGVSRLATQKEISAAYWQLAKKYHPLLNWSPEAKDILKEIKEAYDVLSNPYKRNRYDLGLEIYTACETLEEKEAFMETPEFQEFSSAWESIMKNKYAPPRKKFWKKIIVSVTVLVFILLIFKGVCIFLCL